jgi:hypothetical protein
MRRLLLLVTASVLALGALPCPVWADLFVSSGNSQVLQYNGTTGAFIDAFVAAGLGGLSSPTFLVFRSSAAISTLSEWGMIGMGMLLASLGLWAMRRRPA